MRRFSRRRMRSLDCEVDTRSQPYHSTDLDRLFLSFQSAALEKKYLDESHAPPQILCVALLGAAILAVSAAAATLSGCLWTATPFAPLATALLTTCFLTAVLSMSQERFPVTMKQLWLKVFPLCIYASYIIFFLAYGRAGDVDVTYDLIFNDIEECTLMELLIVQVHGVASMCLCIVSYRMRMAAPLRWALSLLPWLSLYARPGNGVGTLADSMAFWNFWLVGHFFGYVSEYLERTAFVARLERDADADANAAIEQRLTHVVLGSCGTASGLLRCLEEKVLGNRPVPPAEVLSISRHAQELLDEASRWCRRRQLRAQLTVGTYASKLLLCDVGELLKRLVRDDGHVLCKVGVVWVDELLLGLAVEEALANARAFRETGSRIMVVATVENVAGAALHAHAHVHAHAHAHAHAEEQQAVHEAGVQVAPAAASASAQGPASAPAYTQEQDLNQVPEQIPEHISEQLEERASEQTSELALAGAAGAPSSIELSFSQGVLHFFGAAPSNAPRDPPVSEQLQTEQHHQRLAVRIDHLNAEGVPFLCDVDCEAVLRAARPSHFTSAGADGIGLPGVAQAAAKVGGSLRVSMHPSSGYTARTNFRLTLPVRRHSLSPSRASPSRRGFSASEPPSAAPAEASASRAHAEADADASDQPRMDESHESARGLRSRHHKPLFCIGIDDQHMCRSLHELVFETFLHADMARSGTMGKTQQEIDAFVDAAMGRVELHTLNGLPLEAQQQADVVIIDQNLTIDGITTKGDGLAQRLREELFGGVVVVMTGAADAEVDRIGAMREVDLAVSKNVSPEFLAGQIEAHLLRLGLL